MLISGCNSAFRDHTSAIRPQVLKTPEGTYEHVAWLDASLIAFVYAPKFEPRSFDYQIGLYSLDQQEMMIISAPLPNHCYAGEVLWTNRLPDGNLGLVNECKVVNDGNFYVENTLYLWEKRSNEFHALQKYEQNFHATDYTFSPDLSQLIQARLSNKIYRVANDGTLTQLFIDYARVASPSWSPNGETVAFACTKAISEPPISIIAPNPTDVAYPWDLCLMNADGTNTRVIFSGIKFLAFVKWSPMGRWIAFRGEYQGLDGIWVLDTQTSQLARIWADQSFYDWSPDGKQMVIIKRTKRLEVDGIKRTQPVIIDLPTELYESAK